MSNQYVWRETPTAKAVQVRLGSEHVAELAQLCGEKIRWDETYQKIEVFSCSMWVDVREGDYIYTFEDEDAPQIFTAPAEEFLSIWAPAPQEPRYA